MNNIQQLTEWEIVIGLEVHAQISSDSKLFSRSLTKFGAAPNSQVSLIDAALPGTLPIINKYCVEQAVKTGLALDATINLTSIFDRKNYFYADLPQGYQISQFSNPIVTGGKLTIDLAGNQNKTINITRIHLEQDAGKSLHEHSPNYSYIDLNRSGIGLMEIVSEPELRSSYEAGEYMKKLRTLLRYLGSCDGDMEKGSLRCDANVSVRKFNAKLGTRCEIKNLNSIRNIIRAIDYEVERQIELLTDNQVIQQETRLFDPNSGITKVMRSKEDAQDYRYFPDPDLLPLNLNSEYVEEVRSRLPELPEAKKNRYIKQFNLSNYDASILVADQEVANYFEEVATQIDPKLAANWITAELFAKLNKYNLSIEMSKVSAKQLVGLLRLINDQVISGKIAKGVFEQMFESSQDAEEIVKQQGLTQITNQQSVIKLIEQVIANNSQKVTEYKNGKEKLFGFFVGQVMKLSGGKVNPELLNKLLIEYLNNYSIS